MLLYIKHARSQTNPLNTYNSAVWLGEVGSFCRPEKNGSKTASGPWVPHGHFRPDLHGSLHSNDAASVRETVRQISHMYHPRVYCQSEVSFVATLGPIHQQCVHGGAMQLLTVLCHKWL
jgi:hypothetical protein